MPFAAYEKGAAPILIAMFESIAISSRSAPGRDFEIEDLAESLLYYGRVHLIGNAGLVTGLVGAVGTLQLIELIERGHISVQYERTMLAIQTHTDSSGHEIHDIVGVTPQNEPEDFIVRSLVNAGWDKYQAKIKARRLSKFIAEFSYDGYTGDDARRHLLDPRLGTIVVPEYLKQFNAGHAVPQDYRFEVNESGRGLVVQTNLDLAAATEAYRKTYGYKIETVTPAIILDAARQAFDQQYISAALRAEARATPLVTCASSIALGDAAAQATQSQSQIAPFEEFVFEGAGSLRTALTSGKRTFDDFLKLLRRAERFKEWVAKETPSGDLLKEYHRSIARESFLESLPGKTTRYAVFTGGGLVADALLGGVAGVASAATLGAADTFLANKIRLGWKPNHFVTGPLRSFVKGDDKS